MRYIFQYGSHLKYYTASADTICNDRLEIKPFDGEISEDLLPDGGLFANSHTCDYGIEEEKPVEETLFVDGEWEMPEFGDFYRRYSDVYLFLASIKTLFSPVASESRRNKIAEAIVSKPYKGGGSYLSLFKDLRWATPFSERPGLDSISYASPGQMEIRGDVEVFEKIEHLVKNFLKNKSEIKEAHDELRDYMSKSKLLTVRAANQQLSSEQFQYLKEAGEKLDKLMTTESFENLCKTTNNNVIVVNKITLAVYRRLLYTSTFFAQGRVGFSPH